jgi:ABC-type branched-subunit amino acid transport system substrate-binding protein
MFKKSVIAFLLLFVFAPQSFAEDVSPRAELLKRLKGTELLKVGVSLPLTGDLAEYGQAVKNAILLAQNTSNAAVQYVFEDNQYDSQMALSAYRKLVTAEKVHMLFSWGEVPLAAIANLAEREEVPLLAMSIDPTPAMGKQYVLRTINPANEFAKVMLTHLRSSGFKKFAVVQAEDPFMSSMVSGLKASMEKGESLNVLAEFSPIEQDFRATISKLRGANTFDALGVYLISGQVSTFFKQLKSNNVQMPTFGTDCFEGQLEIQSAEGAMEGALSPNLVVPDSFRELYVKMYGNDTQLSYAYNAYETFGIISGLPALVAEGDDGLKLLEVVGEQAKKATSLSYQQSEGYGPYLQFPLEMHQVKNGKVVAAGLK